LVLPAALLVVLLGCSRGAGDSISTDAVPQRGEATPVRVEVVMRTTVSLTVSGPGRTEALREVRIRATFAGRLAEFSVADGDRVQSGEAIGALVAQTSDAALEGARSMLASARTDQQRADAKRALELAMSDLVRQPLRAPASGVVLSHAANAGDFVSEGDVIATIADATSVAFVAQVSQSELRSIRRGQDVVVELAAEGQAAPGIVHGVLPTASAENLNAPVRIDFVPARRDLHVGLFGTARITVAQHQNVLVVPASAVLRDDITGVTRAAMITPDSLVRWVEVVTAARQGDALEVSGPALQPGTRVIVSGHVGLPEGTRIRVEL
jgi:RND family efflux transporter MFP subunit